jgi:mannose-P-dolichol utilization defect protein 1
MYRPLSPITLSLLLLILLIQFNSALPVQKQDDLNSRLIDDLDTNYRWPSIISTPLVKLLGDTCYETLLEEFHITDIPCLKLAISKGLGLGIVVGGAIVKIPQIITIVKHQSAKGLSLTSFLLETCAYEIVLVYNTRLYHPFSTYGEVLFMTLQNICIALLIVYYNNKNNSKMTMVYLIGAFWGGFLILQVIPSWFMAVLYAAQIPIGLASKVPQIRANYVNYFIGTAARSFTTYAELDDPIMLGGNLSATVLNGILVVQLIIYYQKPSPLSSTLADREVLHASSNKVE